MINLKKKILNKAKNLKFAKYPLNIPLTPSTTIISLKHLYIDLFINLLSSTISFCLMISRGVQTTPFKKKHYFYLFFNFNIIFIFFIFIFIIILFYFLFFYIFYIFLFSLIYQIVLLQ